MKLYYYTSPNRMAKTHIRTMRFPGGEMNVNIQAEHGWRSAGSLAVNHVHLVSHIQSSDDLMATLLATDALRRVYTQANIHLTIPYLPYARQDRVCNPGESLSVSVLAKLINAQDYKTVTVVDPHSPASVSCIDRVCVIEQRQVFSNLVRSWADWVIVAPDQGALKKTEDFAKSVGAKGVIACAKNRELKTGKITGMSVVSGQEFVKSGKLFVLDDICDGGRTFVGVAEILRKIAQPGILELGITHGIFSQGTEVLTSAFDRVYSANTFHPMEVLEKMDVYPLAY